MASGAVFLSSCPTCGRRLQIRVELLNHEVQCCHCNAEFRASQRNETPWIDRAVDQALAKAEQYMASVGHACRD